MLSRTSFRFSARGTQVACLTAPRPGDWRVETWSLPSAATGGVLLDDLQVRGPNSQVLPTDAGRVLLCQPLGTDAGGHDLTLGAPAEPARALATVPTLGLRVLEHPDPDVLAMAVSTASTPELTSTVWVVRDTIPIMEPVCTVAGLLAGGCWLDLDGRRLGLNQVHQGKLVAVVIDLADGTVIPLWPDHPDVRLLFACPGSGRLVAGDESGALGCAEPDGRMHWSARLDGTRGAFPLAADPTGEQLAVRIDYGARSGLALYAPASDQVTELQLPAGTVGATASWVGDTLRIPFADGEQPATVVALRPSHTPAAAQQPVPDRASDGLQLESFSGPSGPIEAVVHGDWRTAGNVVVALHGGPDSSWRLDHGPLLLGLAGEDTAVVGVNPRGSHGYRGAHEALHAGWGNADLADVLAVTAHITEQRDTTVQLFGVSYGAFLATLALAAAPTAWARAAVVAPFLSGPRLYADGGTRVRALLERLGGTTTHRDELGPRDLAHVAGQVRTPLLLMHGAADDVVPVAHSRELADQLRAAGTPVEYVELADAAHDPFAGAAAEAALARIRDFLADAPQGLPAGQDAAVEPRGGTELALERR
ncbi:MAG: prolyl oligopeptidase family serine peptidase [Streptosporangiales bacterium]|nr:prolyl oligopeptidase family serine peptidase [Streptosporangiales bacterium]